MGERQTRELAINALRATIGQRKPEHEVLVHSDQGSQFSSHDWQAFLTANRLRPSMSRRGNCHDNAVAESFFQLLKRERIKRKAYPTRNHARADVSTTSKRSTTHDVATDISATSPQSSLYNVIF